MVDIDTFLTILYVMVDDFDKTCLPPECRPGPAASLTRAEVLMLALMGQWQCFESERAFYRYVQRHWRSTFPTLPDRGQFNRLMRRHRQALVACFRHLVGMLDAQRCPFELLDGTGAPIRDAKRRVGAGCRDWPISAGAIGSVGTKAFTCSWPSTPSASSPALALGRQVPRTSDWPRPSSRRAIWRIPNC